MTAASGVAAAAENEPRFVTTVPEPTITPGQTTGIQFTLENTADDIDDSVETATDIRATLHSGDTNISVLSGERIVGTLENDQRQSLQFNIQVPTDIAAGEHDLDLEIEYVNDDDRETTTVPVTVRVEPRPRFRIVSTEADVPIGGSGFVSLTLENVGEEAVSDATLALQSQASALRLGQSTSSSRFVGSVAPGERATVEYRVSTLTDADPQRYAMTGTLSFEDENGNAGQSQRLSLGVVPFEQDFAINATQSTLQVGLEGTLSGRVVNRGPDGARDAVLKIVSQNANVQPVETAVPLATVGANESTTYSFPLRILDGATPGERQFEFVVEYEDGDGNTKRSDSLDVRADVQSGLEFATGNAESSLRVGEEGDFSFAVTNSGPGVARSAVVRLVSQNRNLDPEETESPLGTLGHNESTRVTFPIETVDEAAPGARQLDFVVEYTNREDERRQSTTLSFSADVAPSRRDFQVDIGQSTVQQGATETFDIRVTNNRNETLRNIDAKAFFTDPLSSDDDEAFIGELAPGESATITLGVAADSGASPKSYPIRVDFQYDRPSGETVLSDTYRGPITVSERTDDGSNGGISTPLIAGAAVLVAGAVGVLWYRRRSP